MANNFKKGDVVKCINLDGKSKISFLKKGNEYVVNNTVTCACNKQFVDVGLFFSTKTQVECPDCKICFPLYIDYSLSERFVKRQELSIEQQIEEAVKTENYELAEELQKQLIK